MVDLNTNINLDQEWVQLLLEAKKLGLSLSELQDFFKRD